MKKATKGALAAAAAGTLMLGGAGTLAFWTDSGTVTGGTINSGELSMTDPECAAAPAHPWQFDGGGAFTAGTSKIVPGDTLTKVCTFTVTVAGDNIAADLAVATPGWGELSDAALTSKLAVTSEFTVAGSPVTSVDSTSTVQVEISVDFPFGSVADNTTNVPGGLDAILNDITVTATQAEPS